MECHQSGRGEHPEDVALRVQVEGLDASRKVTLVKRQPTDAPGFEALVFAEPEGAVGGHGGEVGLARAPWGERPAELVRAFRVEEQHGAFAADPDIASAGIQGEGFGVGSEGEDLLEVGDLGLELACGGLLGDPESWGFGDGFLGYGATRYQDATQQDETNVPEKSTCNHFSLQKKEIRILPTTRIQQPKCMAVMHL